MELNELHAHPEVVLQILIANPEGAILMVQRPSGQWQFVGGRLNKGESWEAALRREIFEETAIREVEILSVMAVDNWTWEGIPQFGVFFTGRTEATAVTLSKDHVAFRWVSREDEFQTDDFFHFSLQVMLGRALRGEVDFQFLPRS